MWRLLPWIVDVRHGLDNENGADPTSTQIMLYGDFQRFPSPFRFRMWKNLVQTLGMMTLLTLRADQNYTRRD